AGCVFLALAGGDGRYWAIFLAPIIVLGLGMAVTVAPHTTSVINAVAVRQAGVVSGINNAVASVANLLAVAIFGAIALAVFDHALDQHIASRAMSADVVQALSAARGNFVTDIAMTALQGEDPALADTLIRQSLADGIRVVMGLAAALALAGAASVVLTVRPAPKG